MHSSGCIVRGWRNTINNKSAGVTGPALQSQGNGRVSSISHKDLYTHTHTFYIEYLYTYTHLHSAPCCQFIMPPVIVCFVPSA